MIFWDLTGTNTGTAAVFFSLATGTAVPGHVRPTGTDSGSRHKPAKFRKSLRLSSTFHILGRQYMESTTKKLIINTSPFYCKF